MLCLLLMSLITFGQEKKTDKLVTVKESEVRQWATELRECDLIQNEYRMMIVQNARYKDDVKKLTADVAKKKESIKYLSILVFIVMLFFIVTHYFSKK